MASKSKSKQRKIKQEWWKKALGWCNENEWLLVILLLTLLLRIPSWFEPHRYADEDIYFTLGQGMRKGLQFYRDIHDNKPPLIYVLAGLTGSVKYLRLLLTGWNLLNVWLIWEISKRVIKKNWVVMLTTAAFAVLSSIPLTEGNIANGEIFMIMPATAGVLVLLIAESKKRAWKMYGLAGVLFSVAFLFKVPIIFDVMGVLLWLTWWKAKSVSEWIKGLVDRRAWTVGVAFLVPIGLTVIYYFLVGAGEEYIRAALGQNFWYISAWGGGGGAFWMGGVFQRGAVLLLLTGGLFLVRKWITAEFGLMAMWSAWALFGMNLAGRPYPHYVIEVIPPMVLMGGMMVDRVKRVWQWGVGIVILLTLGAALYVYDFWYYQSWSYYENFIEYIIGDKDRDAYWEFFGGGVRRNYEVARYIKMRTKEDDQIFIWGTEPAIYVLADRLPVGKYAVAYHIVDFDGYEQIMEQIREVMPKYIVVMENEPNRFKELESFVSANYVMVEKIDEAIIFRDRLTKFNSLDWQ